MDYVGSKGSPKNHLVGTPNLNAQREFAGACRGQATLGPYSTAGHLEDGSDPVCKEIEAEQTCIHCDD